LKIINAAVATLNTHRPPSIFSEFGSESKSLVGFMLLNCDILCAEIVITIGLEISEKMHVFLSKRSDLVTWIEWNDMLLRLLHDIDRKVHYSMPDKLVYPGYKRSMWAGNAELTELSNARRAD
ncbi:hypothetical protein J6590_086836, partial [Homalodisca vitripennis]